MAPHRGALSAASYTDDTSLPHAGCRVSIHAQIIREHPIHWFFVLKNNTPHVDGEFKEYAVRTLFNLAESEREKVFKTLRTVRIHIVDPRPYTLPVHDTIRPYLPKGTTVTDFLRRLENETQHLQSSRELALKHVAASMLRDGVAHRLRLQYRAWECTTQVAINDWFRPAKSTKELEDGIDLSPFQHKNSNILNDVANFLSASAAVFSPALDAFEEARADESFSSPLAGPWLLGSNLSHSHAFDEGHSDRLKWIEGQRESLLSELDRRQDFYPSYFIPEPLQELISAESVPIQAADIAASVARHIWRHNNLVHLVRRFEYVSYNGERLSELRAAAHEINLREIGEVL
jgi:hypothetical protein